MAGEPILVVDDNPSNLKLARVLLAGEGYDVRTAPGADEARAVLRETPSRLIVMDIQLLGMDGLALTRLIRGDPAHRGVVILALTAYAMKGDDRKALDAGCDGYLTKPVDTRALPGIVAGWLARGAGGGGRRDGRRRGPHAPARERHGP